MIFNQRLHKRNSRIILIVCVVIGISISGYFVRQLIHRSILQPLETRAEIQAEFLEDLGVNAENFSEVELKIEPFKRTDSAESIVLKDGEVIWNDFAERTRLQTVRQQLKDFPKDKWIDVAGKYDEATEKAWLEAGVSGFIYQGQDQLDKFAYIAKRWKEDDYNAKA